MSGAERIRFAAMRDADLPWVATQDERLYPFPWSVGNFEDSLRAGHSAWMMFDADEPVGYAVMMMVLDEAHILNISVVGARQRGGLGRLLLDHLARVARDAGATQFFLEVRPSNTAALALYAKTGFAQIGRRKGYYPAAEGREDALVLRAAL